MNKNPEQRLQEIKERLEELPKGTLTYKTINGKKQPYLQRTIDGKSVSYYVKQSEREQIMVDLEERNAILEEQKRLFAYLDSLKDILKINPYLNAQVGIGHQEFDAFVGGKQFYVDKTWFIREWWEDSPKVTLITRPRRFGKTLMLSTVEYFFSTRFADREKDFEKLDIWKKEKYRNLKGTIPVIFVSFGASKGANYKTLISQIAAEMRTLFSKHDYLLHSDGLLEKDKQCFLDLKQRLWESDETAVFQAVPFLGELLYKNHGILPILLLDEYDTPLQEAYVGGYWEEAITFCRTFFNQMFKLNSYYQKALITGITKISKNALFSDMNNLNVVTVTSDQYGEAFGFTEREVEDALKCQNIELFPKVKALYDGFTFGKTKDMYNPWSISCFLREGKLLTYWINTSSNELIGELIRRHRIQVKHDIEDLLKGEKLHKKVNENLALQYLDDDEDAFWALLLATGYIRAENIKYIDTEMVCDISITNRETMAMFRSQILRMFKCGVSEFNEFAKSLLSLDEDWINDSLNSIMTSSISYFDGGRNDSQKMPENFYHGLVLGMIISLKDKYQITSNRESGYRRYDIAMVPLNREEDAFILEFRVRNARREKNLQETAESALRQIREKNYEADILAQGIPRERIHRLGLAFEGKTALVVLDTVGM